MKYNSTLSLSARVQRGCVFALAALVAPLIHGSTLWTGPNITFTQFAPNPTDQIVAGVALDRNSNGPLYNKAAGETASNFSTSPVDTMWAFGTIDNATNLSYRTFAAIRNAANRDLAAVILPNKPMVVHLINEDIYLSLTFTAWGQNGNGGFSYTRSTAPVAVPPTVTITNPAGGAVFAAPANVKLGASASVSGGTVTNVQFLANGTPVGSVTSAPFNVTSSALGTGSYTLTAIATAGGITATSSPVSISVVTPVIVTVSGPQISNNQFIFSYTATPGLRYVVTDSSTVSNWVPVVTNVPTNSTVSFTTPVTLNGAQYFRVGQLPNP